MRAAALAVLLAAALAPFAAVSQEATPAPPVITGPTPVAGGTACPGESDPGRRLAGPSRITIAPESAAYYVTHNPRNFGLVILFVRLDGAVAIGIPTTMDLDAPLHAALIDFAKRLTVIPPIPGCVRPLGIVIARFSVPDGAMTFTQQPIGASPSPQPATP
jgi:hypothetical protein